MADDERAEPLRILHLCAYHLFTGPAEPVLNLARTQRRMGHTVEVAFDTVRPGDLAERAATFGIRLDPRFALSVKSGPILLLRDLLALKRCWRLGKVDILHVHRSHDHTLAALARPRRTSVRLVRTLHSERSVQAGRDWQLRRADGLVVPAAAWRLQLIERGVAPPGRVVAIQGAVDPQRFCPGPGGDRVRSEAGLAPGAPVAGMVARMKPGRDHDLLLDAWPRVVDKLPQARLLLAGRGELEEGLRRRVATAPWGDTVAFPGYRSDLPALYRALDLKVLLAPGNDGTCRAGLEAMACGVPLLASDRGALGEMVVDGKTGRVVPAGSADALAAALLELLSDRDRLRVMGARARREAIARFSAMRQANEIERLYRAVHDARS